MLHWLRELPLIPAALVYLALALFAAVLVRNALRRWLDRVESRMDTNLHRVLMRSLPRPAGAALFLFLVSIGARFVPLPSNVETLTKHVIPFCFGTLAVLVLMRIALSAITAYGEGNPQLKSTAGIARAFTWVLGLVLIAVLVSDAAGVSLAPALTALGVGSLSVALALQDTLSNFFAGVYLLLDKPIRPGDFVQIDGGREGYVEAIGWRSTHLRTLAPSTVIVPNATLSKSVIVNFRATNPRLLLATPIDVALDAPIDRADAAMNETLADVKEIPGIDASQKPFTRFALGDRGLTFTLYATILPSGDGGLVQQEIRKRAIRKLRANGVALAEPLGIVKRA